MPNTADVPLVLGGHSFISQLGNDPAPSADEQAAIVAACLDQGIRWLDTTYQPERLALGQALRRLGRRDEATLLAWNFFKDFDRDGDVGGPDYYQPQHIDLLRRQLQTDVIDGLVVHPLQDAERNRQQDRLALSWEVKGYVRQLGVWFPGADLEKTYGLISPFRFMVRPCNIATRDAAPPFAAARRLGWQTLACSPFVRGWELDRLFNNAMRLQPSRRFEADIRARLADHLLRYALFQPNVDRLIVAIRKVEWVARNVDSVRRGKLSPDELDWLNRLYAMA